MGIGKNFSKQYFSLSRRLINLEKLLKKQELSYTIDKNVNWYNHFEGQVGSIW